MISVQDAFAALHIVAHLTAQRAVYEEEERSIVGVLGGKLADIFVVRRPELFNIPR
jgi:hypothetical protein